MKYLISLFLFFLALAIFFIFNTKGIIIWQTFLIFSLLIFLIIDDYKITYTFAIFSGLFLDSFTAIFGLHALIFLLIIFIVSILKKEILGIKNILTILLLIFISFFLYYLFTYLFYFLNGNTEYFYYTYNLIIIISSLLINTLITIVLYLIHYNFKKDGRSF